MSNKIRDLGPETMSVREDKIYFQCDSFNLYNVLLTFQMWPSFHLSSTILYNMLLTVWKLLIIPTSSYTKTFI